MESREKAMWAYHMQCEALSTRCKDVGYKFECMDGVEDFDAVATIEFDTELDIIDAQDLFASDADGEMESEEAGKVPVTIEKAVDATAGEVPVEIEKAVDAQAGGVPTAKIGTTKRKRVQAGGAKKGGGEQQKKGFNDIRCRRHILKKSELVRN